MKKLFNKDKLSSRKVKYAEKWANRMLALCHASSKAVFHQSFLDFMFKGESRIKFDFDGNSYKYSIPLEDE
jgi:hypothetical protein